MGRMKTATIFLLSGLLAYASAKDGFSVCEQVANRIYVPYKETLDKPKPLTLDQIQKAVAGPLCPTGEEVVAEIYDYFKSDSSHDATSYCKDLYPGEEYRRWHPRLGMRWKKDV